MYFLFGVDVDNGIAGNDNLFTLLFKINLKGDYKDIKANFGELINVPIFKFIIAMIGLSLIIYMLMIIYSVIKGKMSNKSFIIERKMIINAPKTIIKMVVVPVGTLFLVIGFSFIVSKSYNMLKNYLGNGNGNDTLTKSIFINNFYNIRLELDSNSKGEDNNSKNIYKWNEYFKKKQLNNLSFNVVDTHINDKKNKELYKDIKYPLDFMNFKFSYILAFITAISFGYGLVLTTFTSVKRISKILIYLGLAPIVIIQENMDNGAKYNNWKKSILESIISLVSTLFTFLITFLLIFTITGEITKLKINGGETVINFAKLLLKCIIIGTLGYIMPQISEKINSIITSGIGGDDSNITGGESDTHVKGGSILSKFTPMGKVLSKLKNNTKKKMNDKMSKIKSKRNIKLKKKAQLRDKISKNRIDKKYLKKPKVNIKAKFLMAKNKVNFIKDKALHGRLGSERRAKYETRKAEKELKIAKNRKNALNKMNLRLNNEELGKKEKEKLNKKINKQKEKVYNSYNKLKESKKEYDRQRKEQNKINIRTLQKQKDKTRKGNLLNELDNRNYKKDKKDNNNKNKTFFF